MTGDNTTDKTRVPEDLKPSEPVPSADLSCEQWKTMESVQPANSSTIAAAGENNVAIIPTGGTSRINFSPEIYPKTDGVKERVAPADGLLPPVDGGLKA